MHTLICSRSSKTKQNHLAFRNTRSITALNFINHGAIDITGSGSSSGSFEITAGYTVINQGSIVSGNGSLDITTDDFFRTICYKTRISVKRDYVAVVYYYTTIGYKARVSVK